jgi:hypothetical protein
MTISAPNVMPILATPLGRVAVVEADTLNSALISHISRRRSEERSPPANPLVYRSADDLFERPEPEIKQLTVDMVRGALSVISGINSLQEAEFESLRLETRGWLTLIDQHGCLPASTHPLTAWCVIYCIASPVPAPTRQDSGILRFYQSGFGTMLQDATNATLRMPFMTGHYAWRPTPGEMVVFPASTVHEIALLHTPGPLILATARLRFVAPGQQGLSRW